MAGAPLLVLGVVACMVAALGVSRTRSRGTACQFARVVKGVDLRSTAGNCARVRTPQLTSGKSGSVFAWGRYSCRVRLHKRQDRRIINIAERGFDPRTFGL